MNWAYRDNLITVIILGFVRFYWEPLCGTDENVKVRKMNRDYFGSIGLFGVIFGILILTSTNNLYS